MAFRMEGVVEFDPSARAGILSNDDDADGTSLSATLVAPPANGALTLNPDGTFSYLPDVGFSGSDSFVYRAWDGELYSDPTTVRIVVSPPGKASEDFNADGAVDNGDLAFLLASYGKSASAKAIEGDLDGDGRIGVRDAIALRNAFTQVPAPAAVVANASDRAFAQLSEDSGMLRASRRVRRPSSDVSLLKLAAADPALATAANDFGVIAGGRARILGRKRS
jgi:hypothetical protein